MAHNSGHFEKVRALAVGARVLVVGGSRAGAASQLTFFDHSSHKRVLAVDVPSHVAGLATGGDAVVAACGDGRLRIYKIGTGAFLREIEAHASRQVPRLEGRHGGTVLAGAVAVAVAPDADRVVSAGVDGWLRVHSLASGKKLHEWQVSNQPLRAAAFDPSGEFVAGAGDDGVVHVVTVVNGERRELPGHEGPVNALAFTPRDGRILSGGEDGTLRLFFLVGDTEGEARGNDDSNHVGPVLAVVFAPSPKGASAEHSDRYYSVGADGTFKAWRLGDRRKPRTVELGGALRALALAPKGGSQTAGTLFAGGDARTITTLPLDAEGNPQDKTSPIGHGLQLIEESLASSARPAHETAIKALSALDEQEAIDLLLKHLVSNRFPEVRELVARELAARGREVARPALRERLRSESSTVARLAAYEALKVLEAATPLAAPRAGLESTYPEIRSLALTELALLHESSPLVSGLIADKLRDGDRTVRLAALDAYTSLFPAGSPEPFKTAFERGPADLRAEALVRAALARQLSSPALEPVLARALDDVDSEVRRAAFALKILERPALFALLESRDQDVGRACNEVARQAARFLLGSGKKDLTDALVAEAQQKLLGPAGAKGDGPHGLSEDDLRPLLAAMACRTADTALRGARGLAELGDTRALGALLQLSREGDKAIRREAARALGALEDPRAKKRLVWMLDDADADVRAAALDAFSKLEASAVELAEGALRSSQQDIRVRGLSMLVKQSGSRSVATDTLLGDALEDESPEVRGEAFRTLWAWHQKDPQKALDRALQARFPDLRLKAVSELESSGKEEWAQERLLAAIGDRDAKVAQAAYDALVKIKGKPAAKPHLAALASIHATVRVAGAEGAKKSPVDEVRSALTLQLNDSDSAARGAALGALDKLVTRESGPLYAGLQSSFHDLKVLAAELLADRHDEQIIETIRAFLSDKELLKTQGTALLPLRYRAAKALATLGSPRLLKYFATELLKDDHGDVREQAARGLSNASRKGDEGFLLDALGHTDIAVRSWAAEGLSRLGDARALPVLTGHLRHEHQPIRLGAILSFAALGPEGYGGMLQGLEDPSKDVQEIVFMLILARDLRAFRRGESPELLTSALSSQRPEVRFAAARAIELRSEPARYLDHLVEVLLPPRPEKASEMKDWPAEERRSRLVVGLAEALAGDRPELRYAAAQTLQIRRKPLDFFKQIENVVKPRSASAAVTPETTPTRIGVEGDTKSGKGWLRRLFAEGVSEADGAARVEVAVNDSVPDAEQQRLRWLAFGAYVGLLRQVVAGDDEGHRVRRDAIERVVELSREGYVSRTASIPPLVRALDDPHYLVRRGALVGLKKLYPDAPDEPLTLALSSISEDVSRLALDELATRGEAGKGRIARALNSSVPEVRKYAFELLEKLCPKGSLEPLIFAIESDYSDMRLGVIERLASSRDARVSAALVRATQSDHEDLRLRAAELLALRKDDLAAEVLAGFLRHDDEDIVGRARDALAVLGSLPAVTALGARLGELTEEDAVALIETLGRTGHPAAADVLIPFLIDGSETIASAVIDAAKALAEVKVRESDSDEEKEQQRDYALLVRVLRAASRAKEVSARKSAAEALVGGPEAGQSEALTQFFADRDKEIRAAAVDSYSRRVRERGAPVAPLEPVLRAGVRELLLAAAEGVAFKQGAGALRPLLLFVRAGESGERERAILALGSLGDLRALPELEVIAAGGTPEAPVEESMQLAAVEAFGRLFRAVTSPETRQRLLERIEQADAHQNSDHQQAAIRAFRYIGDERARLKIEAKTSTQHSFSWQTRVEAVKNLVLLGDKASEPVLARSLGDSDSDVRREARTGLLKLFPGERTRVELHALLLGGDDLPTEAALYLAEQGDTETLLLKLPEVKDDDARSRLLFGLLRRPELKASSLVTLLGHEKATNRDNGAWLIGARAGGEGATALTAGDRSALVAGLLAAETRAAQGSKKLLGDEQAQELVAWRRTIWALRGLTAREALPRLRELTTAAEQSVPGPVRQEAAISLASLGHDKADVEALKGALRDPDAEVRAAAAAGLAAIAPEQAAALVLAVQPFDPVAFEAAVGRKGAGLLVTEPGRRVSLPSVLVSRDARAIKALLDGAKDEPTLLDAIGAAGNCGGDELIAALTVIAADKKNRDAATRKAAYRALKRAKRQAEYRAKAGKKIQEVAP